MTPPCLSKVCVGLDISSMILQRLLRGHLPHGKRFMLQLLPLAPARNFSIRTIVKLWDTILAVRSYSLKHERVVCFTSSPAFFTKYIRRCSACTW